MPTAVIFIVCHYHSFYTLSQWVLVRPVTTGSCTPCHKQSLYTLSQPVVVHTVTNSPCTPCHNRSLYTLSQTDVVRPDTTGSCTPCHKQSFYALSQPMYWHVPGKFLWCQIRIFQCAAVLMNANKLSHLQLRAITRPHINYPLYCFRIGKCHREWPDPDFTRRSKVSRVTLPRTYAKQMRK